MRPEDSPLYLMVFSVTSYSGLVFPVDIRAFTYFYCQVSDDDDVDNDNDDYVGFPILESLSATKVHSQISKGFAEDKLRKVNFVKGSFPLDSVWRTTTRSTSTTATGTAGGRRRW